MDNFLEIKNLTKSYKDAANKICVLNNVNFTLKKGQFVALMGPSGSGKSTLLNLIGLLDGCDSGEIILNGKTINKMSENKKAKVRISQIGFVFQFDSLLPEFTLLENVQMPALLKGKTDVKPAKKLLQEFGLEALAHKMPAEMSGGEKQRGAIARALRNSPSLILADEPTGNLDIENAKTVYTDLQRLAKQGVTVIMATHNIESQKYTDLCLKVEDKTIKVY